MNNLREYWNNMSTEQLQAILREDCEGSREIPFDTVMIICQILAERNPQRLDPEESYRRFRKKYRS